jgi:hypothetical protein
MGMVSGTFSGMAAGVVGRRGGGRGRGGCGRGGRGGSRHGVPADVATASAPPGARQRARPSGEFRRGRPAARPGDQCAPCHRPLPRAVSSGSSSAKARVSKAPGRLRTSSALVGPSCDVQQNLDIGVVEAEPDYPNLTIAAVDALDEPAGSRGEGAVTAAQAESAPRSPRGSTEASRRLVRAQACLRERSRERLREWIRERSREHGEGIGAGRGPSGAAPPARLARAGSWRGRCRRSVR